MEKKRICSIMTINDKFHSAQVTLDHIYEIQALFILMQYYGIMVYIKLKQNIHKIDH